MESRIVYHNQDGVRRTSIVDSETPEVLRVFTEVDLTETLESIKRARETVIPGSTNKHVATVPMTVYEKSLVEQWDDNDWKKWFNDPDNAAFRVWQGRV
jgi:hypothetical protein